MHTIRFFEQRFRREAHDGDHDRSPFEAIALSHLRGKVLDLGCGLGNLSLEAARRGHEVTAVDASPSAVIRLSSIAAQQHLRLHAIQTSLARWRIEGIYDTIVAIGTLNCFGRERALELLKDVQDHIAPRGRAIVNVLIEGATDTSMFDQSNYYLFGRNELADLFDTHWMVLESRCDTHRAPTDTSRVFATVIAEMQKE
jgi:tellurite methyltransferase